MAVGSFPVPCCCLCPGRPFGDADAEAVGLLVVHSEEVEGWITSSRLPCRPFPLVAGVHAPALGGSSRRSSNDDNVNCRGNPRRASPAAAAHDCCHPARSVPQDFGRAAGLSYGIPGRGFHHARGPDHSLLLRCRFRFNLQGFIVHRRQAASNRASGGSSSARFFSLCSFSLPPGS